MADYLDIVKNVLTLDEMYDIFKSEQYKEYRERWKIDVEVLPNGKRWVPYFLAWSAPSRPLLYLHIAAEQLLLLDSKETDWDSYGLNDYCVRHSLFYLLLHPLVWSEPFPSEVVDGRVAREQYMPNRIKEVISFLNPIITWSILHDADNLHVMTEDELDLGYMKGMHCWESLTTDDSELFEKDLEGKCISITEINSVKEFDASTLHNSLSIIATYRGGKRAAELLRMMQKEWPIIRRWRKDWGVMTEEDKDRFEDQLMHGFDSILSEWEEKCQNINADGTIGGNQVVKGLSLITDACKKAGEVENVECRMRAAIRSKNAAQVWSVIINYERASQPYITTEGMSMASIYRALEDRYGKMPFTSRTFSNNSGGWKGAKGRK